MQAYNYPICALKKPEAYDPFLPGFMTSLSLLFNLGIFKFYVRKQLTLPNMRNIVMMMKLDMEASDNRL